jgi:hypothetical protein
VPRAVRSALPQSGTSHPLVPENVGKRLPVGTDKLKTKVVWVGIAWLTNTGVSSARLYVEYKGAWINDFNISVPAAVSVFPEEVLTVAHTGCAQAVAIVRRERAGPFG